MVVNQNIVSLALCKSFSDRLFPEMAKGHYWAQKATRVVSSNTTILQKDGDLYIDWSGDSVIGDMHWFTINTDCSNYILSGDKGCIRELMKKALTLTGLSLSQGSVVVLVSERLDRSS